MNEYELKLANGKTVVWEGTSGEDAARRYVDCRQEDAVIATRPASGPGFYPGVDPRNIIG